MAYSPEQKELLDAIQIMIDKAMEGVPVITTGVVVDSIDDKIYTIRINGQNYNLPHYGTSTISINSIVKVFVPYNNYAMAWFI